MISINNILSGYLGHKGQEGLLVFPICFNGKFIDQTNNFLSRHFLTLVLEFCTIDWIRMSASSLNLIYYENI